MLFRNLIRRWTRSPSPLLGTLEDDSSATSFEDAKLEVKTKNDFQRESRGFWKFSSRTPLIGTFVPQKPRRERKCDVCSFDESLIAEILVNLGLVDQVCFALTCKILFTTCQRTFQDKALLPHHATLNQLPLSFTNSDDKLRVQLLTQLESSRWAYCAECFLLKPQKDVYSRCAHRLASKKTL